MSRRKKLKIFIPIVMLLFLGAFAKHRFIDRKEQAVSHLQSKQMKETSGLAASVLTPGIYYGHNDSGDTSRFFAIDAEGELKNTIFYYRNKRGDMHVRDCEDIAVGPGPAKDKSYVYIGDIGDNSVNRKAIMIYRVAEQKALKSGDTTYVHADQLTLHYPDRPRDAETLMLDPVDKLFYIVTKRGDSVSVYTTPLIFNGKDTVTLTYRCNLFFKGLKPFKWITGGSISHDGKQVLLKSYEKVYYWRRQAGEPIWKAMQREPRELPYKQEKQGEAIAFTPDGKGYYTTSEGVYAPIYYYQSPN
jgi:hypothetical protein